MLSVSPAQCHVLSDARGLVILRWLNGMPVHPQAVHASVQGLAMVGVNLEADVVHRDVVGQGKCLYGPLLEVELKLSQSSVRGSMGLLYLSNCQ
jgi:hypothetical protein